MLFGHIGVGLAAKPAAPRAPLGALLFAATAIGTLSGAFMIAGIESVDPTTGASTIYLTTTQPKDRTGTWSFWLLIAATVLIAATAAVPALSTLAPVPLVLLWPLGNWVDRHRTTKTAAPVPHPA